MSDFPAAPVDIPCHAVQSESLLRAHSCSPKRFSSALLDVSIHGQLRSENRSPPPDKLDSHRLHIPAIHQENSEAMTFVESSCALQAPQEESSTEDTVITSAEASWSSLGEHRSPEKSMKASLEVEVATSKDEIVVLRQQAAKDKEAVARAERRAHEAVAQLQREQQASKTQMDGLTERVDALKDELSTTERLLSMADDKLHNFASHSDQLQAVQKESKNMVGQEQARRRRAEVALEEAVKEVGTAQKGKTLAEMEAEKAQHMLELEVKLRQQISKEKDQVVQQLLEEQETINSLETRLAESDDALTAAAEEVAALRQLSGGERPSSSMQSLVEDLHERVCMAESGRRVAEAAWQDAEEARLDALAARREAETNWQQVSAILEREQNAHRLALTELLSERSARQLAQATLKRVTDRVAARSAAIEPLTARTSGDVRASLLVEVKEERRGLGCLRSALVDVRDTQAETLRHVEDLQRSLGAHGADSAHMHEMESARANTEQGVRLAMVVVHRADQMLGHVSTAADGSIQDLTQGLGGHYLHIGAAPPLSARGRRSSDLGARRPSADEDNGRWEIDSVFPDSYGLLEDMLDSQADSDTLLGSEGTRGLLSGPPSNPPSYVASRDSPDLSIANSFSRGSLCLPGGPTPSPSRPLNSPALSPGPIGTGGTTVSPAPSPLSSGVGGNDKNSNALFRPHFNRTGSETPPGMGEQSQRPPAPRGRAFPPSGPLGHRTIVIPNPTCPNSQNSSPCIEACVETHDPDDEETDSCLETDRPDANENSPLLGNRNIIQPPPQQPFSERLEPLDVDSHTNANVNPPRLSPSQPPLVNPPAPGISGEKRPAIPKLALGSMNPPL